MELSEKDLQFVDLALIDPRIIIEMRYASENNFLRVPLYPVNKCFLRRKVAHKLSTVQDWLEKRGKRLKIFDGYRPLHVQRKFWEFLPDERYVASPEKGSVHNRGAAVDLTLLDSSGYEVMMPTAFDDFTEKAHWAFYDLSVEALANRALLRRAMELRGFNIHPHEWWHYNDVDWKMYPIEDVKLEDL